MMDCPFHNAPLVRVSDFHYHCSSLGEECIGHCPRTNDYYINIVVDGEIQGELFWWPGGNYHYWFGVDDVLELPGDKSFPETVESIKKMMVLL